jgi:hypothetical protein
MPRWVRIAANTRLIRTSECSAQPAGTTRSGSCAQAFPFFACVFAGVDFPDVVFVFVCVIGSTFSAPCSALGATFVPRCTRTHYGVERQCAGAHFCAMDKSVLRNMAKILFLKCSTAGKGFDHDEDARRSFFCFSLMVNRFAICATRLEPIRPFFRAAGNRGIRDATRRRSTTYRRASNKSPSGLCVWAVAIVHHGRASRRMG